VHEEARAFSSPHAFGIRCDLSGTLLHSELTKALDLGIRPALLFLHEQAVVRHRVDEAIVLSDLALGAIALLWALALLPCGARNPKKPRTQHDQRAVRRIGFCKPSKPRHDDLCGRFDFLDFWARKFRAWAE
jgi:hypothetical protein